MEKEKKIQVLLVFSNEELSIIKKAWVKFLAENGGSETLNLFMRKVLLSESKKC